MNPERISKLLFILKNLNKPSNSLQPTVPALRAFPAAVLFVNAEVSMHKPWEGLKATLKDIFQ